MTPACASCAYARLTVAGVVPCSRRAGADARQRAAGGELAGRDALSRPLGDVAIRGHHDASYDASLMYYRLSQLLVVAAVMLCLAGCGGDDDGGASGRAPVILATTTSTQDSGLLDVLIPAFERESGYEVKTIAVGSGEAIEMGARGEADVVLAHSPAAEEQLMADGKGGERRTVMHNDFVDRRPGRGSGRRQGRERRPTRWRRSRRPGRRSCRAVMTRGPTRSSSGCGRTPA